MPDAYSLMRTTLAQWVTFTDEQWAQFTAVFKQMKAKRGTHLVLPNEPHQRIYFVGKGLLRIYYATEDGKEYNKSFIAEGRFGGSLSSCILGRSLGYGIQTLEPCQLLVARYADFAALFDEDLVFERLGRRFAEWLLIKKELREQSFLKESAAERYASFRAMYPALEQRVPQYHIASYLGIAEASLSRLRKTTLEEKA